MSEAAAEASGASIVAGPGPLVPPYWRHWLAFSLSRTLGRPIGDADAVATLDELDGTGLIQLDGHLRRDLHGDWLSVQDFRQRTRLSCAKPADVVACLFASACHCDGYLRQHALRVLETHPSRLATAAILIRCDDWVPDIQRTALEALERLTANGRGAELLDAAELLFRLRGRDRIMERIWPERIEPVLRAPQHADARWALTHHRNTRPRLYGYELTLAADSARRDEALRQAARDPHPRIAAWALSQSLQGPSATVQRAVMAHTFRHPHPQIRAETLRAVYRVQAEAGRRFVDAALLDRSGGPRLTAAYLLRTHHGESAIAYWRQRLDDGDTQHQVPALIALADVAEIQDIPRLAAYRHHEQAAVRAATLRGAAHAGTPDLDTWLAEGLRDASTRVVDTALRLFKKGGGIPQRRMLEDAWATQRPAYLRRRLLHSAPLLEKWNALAFLLARALEPPDETLGIELHGLLDRWQYDANRRFQPLSAPMRAELLDTLDRIEPQSGGYDWAMVRGYL